MLVTVISSGAPHSSVIHRFDVVAGLNGVRFCPQSTLAERLDVLKCAPDPKVINFERYGEDVNASV